MQLLRALIRESLLLEGIEMISYSSLDDLIKKIDARLRSIFETAKRDVKMQHPEHAKVLDRTRFVPVYDGTDVPLGVLDDDMSFAQFLSKCDGLFSGTRLGVQCRADGNKADPPTHNAMYLDVMGSLGLDDVPQSGNFSWSHDEFIRGIISHEFAHAIDALSQFTKDGKIRDVEEAVLLDLFDMDAVHDKETGKDNVTERMRAAGASDRDIEIAVGNFSIIWDDAHTWFESEIERSALAIQLATALDKAGITGPDFIRSNLIEIENEIDLTIINSGLLGLMYGTLSSSGADGIEQIQDAVL